MDLLALDQRLALLAQRLARRGVGLRRHPRDIDGLDEQRRLGASLHAHVIGADAVGKRVEYQRMRARRQIDTRDALDFRACGKDRHRVDAAGGG